MRKSKFNRPELLKIVEQQVEVLKCLEPLEGRFPEANKRLRLLFQRLWYLLSILSADQKETKVTEAEWIRMAKQFAVLFNSQTAEEKATSYLHVFVYHVGSYLEKYHSLESLANYSIEGTVKWVKTHTREASNKFGGNKSNTLEQVIHKHNRMQPFMKRELSKINSKSIFDE